MTENKRFIMLPFEEGNLIFDELKYDFDNEWYDSRLCLKDNEIVDLLNALHEEKQHLQMRCGAMEEEIECLSEEKEQLQRKLQSQEKVIHLSANKIDQLLEENKALQKEKEILIQTLHEASRNGADLIMRNYDD